MDNQLSQKRILTLSEFCAYTGLKSSYVYKLTHAGKIPGVSKPLGKKLYFDREQIDAWLLGNPIMTADQKETAAANRNTTGKLK